jgi:hypothetical protein
VKLSEAISFLSFDEENTGSHEDGGSIRRVELDRKKVELLA